MARSSRRTQRSTDVRLLTSPDGAVSFSLKRTSSGVHVQRTQVVDSGARVAHSLLFSSAVDFRRFCDEDELRFVYPLIYYQIRVTLDALFQLDG